MRAVETDESGRLCLIEAEEPPFQTGSVRVSVNAVSINRGEILRARSAGAGFRPGWDFAGVVGDPSGAEGFAPGTRVAGYLPAGAWAETIVVPPTQMAAIPGGVSVATAASLPVAGLTALGALDAGGNLVGRKVMVTGATGGVGALAVHLAMLSGAQVTAVVRRSADECRHLFPPGTHVLTDAGGLASAREHGPFDLVVETLGGDALGGAMTMLTHCGKCVSLGVTDRRETKFDAEQFFMTGSASLEGFVLFRDRHYTPAQGMERLLRLAAAGKLKVEMGLTESWENIEAVAEKLIGRQFMGKAVLIVRDDRDR